MKCKRNWQRAAIFWLLLPETALATDSANDTESWDCGADDSVCLSQSYEMACRLPESATTATCAAWLEHVETHEYSDQPAWQNIVAAAYYHLAESSESPDRADEYKTHSSRLLHNIISRYPSGPHAYDAYIGLANLTEDPNERIRLFRQAVAADQNHAFAPAMLARQLARTGSEADLIEAAEFMRQAYLVESDPSKWYLGRSTVGLYDAAGQTDKAEEFRRRIYIDSGMEDAEFDFQALADAQHVERTFTRVCNDNLVALFGKETCLSGIDSVVEAVKQEQDPEQQRRLAEAATEGMTRVANAPGIGTDEVKLFSATYEMFISLGVRSSKVYDAWSQRLEDRDLAVSALERAVELSPQDGALVYRLGLAYLGQERWGDAIRTFEKARQNLPAGFSREILDMQLQRAEAGQASAKR